MEHLNYYEKKSIFYTKFSLIGSICWVILKLFLGIFASYIFLASAVFQMFIIISKLYLFININKRDYAKPFDYHFVGIVTAVASLLYGFYFLSIRNNLKSYEMYMALIYAAIAFTEIGVAIFGIFRTKKGVPLFRLLKLLSLCVAMTSLVLCQRAICSFADTAGEMEFLNKYMGFIISIFILFVAIYIYFGNHLGRDNCLYSYKGSLEGKLLITSSRFFPNYYFNYQAENDLVVGKIEIDKNPIFHKNIIFTVIICILSEILIFPYLIGLLIFELRSIDIGKKLDLKLKDMKLQKIHITDNEFDNIYMLELKDNDFSFLCPYLPMHLQDKYQKITNLEYKNSSLAGYFLLLNAIHEYYGCYYFPDFEPDAKPSDLNLDFKFNISHSKGMVILATSYDEIGIDIEHIRELSKGTKKRLFNDENINDLEAIKKWTKLESAIKLEGSSVLKYENIDLKKYNIKTICLNDYAISVSKF